MRHIFGKLAWLSSLALLIATPAAAQEVGECNWRSSAQALAEPWEDNTRTFANGRTRLALLDVIEPAAGSFYLLILSPPEDELGGRQCRVVGLGGGLGFAGVDFAALSAGYDPSVGLMFDIPVSVYVPDDAGFARRQLQLTVNQATGAIDARLW